MLKAFRRLPLASQVIEMVLATDMKQHFSILSHFNTVHRLATYAHNAPSAAAMPQSASLERAGRCGAHVRAGTARGIA